MRKKLQSPQSKSLSASAAETIIAIQSGFLLAIGIAGLLSATTIVAGFKAITNANSAATLITDKAIVSDVGDSIPIDRVESIINNFQIVCVLTLTIGGIVAVASGVRLFLKLRK